VSTAKLGRHSNFKGKHLKKDIFNKWRELVQATDFAIKTNRGFFGPLMFDFVTRA
jgi:hypothetical protein